MKKEKKEMSTVLYLLSFEKSDLWLIRVPPLLKVVHHHRWHRPGETAHGRLERQVPCADDGDVEDAVSLLHRVCALLKLHAGNWERTCETPHSKQESPSERLESVTHCPGRCRRWWRWLRRVPPEQHPEESWETPRKTQSLRWTGSGRRPWWLNCRSVKEKQRQSVIYLFSSTSEHTQAPHLHRFSRFELHFLGTGDVVNPRAGRGGVRRSSGAPHGSEWGQVATVAQHRDLNGAWRWFKRRWRLALTEKLWVRTNTKPPEADCKFKVIKFI